MKGESYGEEGTVGDFVHVEQPYRLSVPELECLIHGLVVYLVRLDEVGAKIFG